MAVKRRKSGSAVSEVFGLGFSVGDRLGESNPAFDGNGSLMRVFMDRFITFVVVVSVNCVVIEVLRKVGRIGRWMAVVVLEVGGFGNRGHGSCIASIEVRTFVFASFSVEDCNIRVFVGCTSSAEEFL
jgi:hypothetical protein